MSSDSQSSFVEATVPSPAASLSDVDSLPSSPTTSSLEASSDDGGDGEETDAEREWKESLQQLELLLTMVVVPYVGKYFGRKCAYWGWAKFMQWKYPVEIVVTSEKMFKGAGVVEAAASL
ncbi:MAG: hypothetical protein L6R35_004105 [Caloplaca aegaea]|nr:MAG: hypothetical protein LQ341_001868 [Variospora aurantia]KAI4286639.1 MAG: hypothetical protein L6R35_004105 [Caloplaca aegaea]